MTIDDKVKLLYKYLLQFRNVDKIIYKHQLPIQEEIIISLKIKSPKTLRNWFQELKNRQILEDKYTYYILHDMEDQHIQANVINYRQYDVYPQGLSQGGIYVIIKNNTIIYVGLTTRPFQIRWNEHRQGFMDKPIGHKLYNSANIDEIQFQVLFDVILDGDNNIITKRDLEAMELAFIKLYKPIGNIMGVEYEYTFSEEAKYK